MWPGVQREVGDKIMKKDQEQYVSFSQDDFSLDMKNNIVHATDPTGKTVAVDTWKYAIYFFDKIQRKDISKESIFIDGIRLDKYVEIFLKENHAQKIVDFIKDKTSCALCEEIEILYNTHINWVALYGLSSYIREIINRRLALLLKPTLQDTISEIQGLENIESVSFGLKDGSSHTTDFCEAKKIIWKSINNSDETTVGFHKIVKKVDVYTHEYGEIEFVRYISKFLHEYFNEVKRRKNSYLTTTEQKLVCFLLKYFGFTPEKVQESRFRQLFNSKYNAIDHIMPLNIPGFFESNVKLYLEYIPYRVWSKGKINPLKEIEMFNGSSKHVFTMQMGERPELKELLDYITGII